VKDWNCFPEKEEGGGRGEKGGGLCGKRSEFLLCSVSCPGEDLFTLIKTSSANRVLLIWFEEARETIKKNEDRWTTEF
jgi:hypothetical protein